MYSIGKFSKLTKVKTQTLIWYDKIGLLKPDYVNEENGYRYYSAKNIMELYNIRLWQSFGFSINDILNLSKDVIERQIKNLHKQIQYITSNISLLEKIKEDNNMNKDLFEQMQKLMPSKVLMGRWSYEKSGNNFRDMVNASSEGYVDKAMPSSLFFDGKFYCSDLKEDIDYTDYTITINNKKYHYFLLNFNRNLVLFNKPEEDMSEPIHFHLFRSFWNKEYTKEQIKALKEQNLERIDIKKPAGKYDGHLDGDWEFYCDVSKSKIEKFDGKKPAKIKIPMLSPMFMNLYFNGEQVKFIAKDQSYTIKGRDKEKTYNYDNANCQLYAYENGELYLFNPILNKRHKIIEKKIDDVLYLIIDIELMDEIDNVYFVYKRV